MRPGSLRGLAGADARDRDAGRQLQQRGREMARLVHAPEMRVGGDQHPERRVEVRIQRAGPAGEVQCVGVVAADDVRVRHAGMGDSARTDAAG